MTKSIRVLLFSTAYLPFVGGAELAIKNIADRLPDVEFDLITAKLKRKLPDFEKIGNVNVYRLGAGNKFFDKSLLPNLGFLKAINLHKNKKYNLIHGVMASQGSAAGYLFKFFYPRVPFILTLQEGDLGRNSPFDRFWQARIMKKADSIVAISRYLVDFAKRYNKKAPIFVAPNGVDLEKFKAKNEKLKTDKEKTIITVSRLVKKNGVDILIKAFQILCLKSYVSNPELLIIGDGKEKVKLEKLAQKLGIADKVKFLGGVSSEEVAGHLTGADVFARPSRSEGLGSAFLEAMAAGVPIIGTPVGGIPDFLKDEETGLFCKPEDPADLANKIVKIFADDNLSKKLSENGRRLVEKRYDWSSIAVRIKEIYEEAINNNSGL